MSVFEPNIAYREAGSERELIEALLADTNGVRKEKFLPKKPNESKDAYAARLGQSYLYNHFGRTINTATGKILAKPLKVTASKPVLDWIENFDAEGTHLDQFCVPLADGMFAHGIGYVLADMPKPLKTENRTLRDDRIEGNRPYGVYIAKQNLIGWRTEVQGGIRKLMIARIREFVTVETEDFKEKVIEQIRVLRPGRWEIWQRDGGEEKIVDSGSTGLDYIPLVPFYAKKTAPFEGRAPFMNLAELNLRHFQSSSEQANILSVARVPIVHIARDKNYDEEGNADNQEVTLSGNMAIETNREDLIKFVEHGGKAIEAGRRDLLDLVDQMDAVSYKLAPRQTSGDVTATETNVVTAEAHVFLSAMAGQFKDSLELLLMYMCDMAGLKEEPTVEVNKDFGTVLASTDMPLLLNMQSAGILKREAVIEGAMRRGLLPEDGLVSDYLEDEPEPEVILEPQVVEPEQVSDIPPVEDSNTTEDQ
jgi:hypothetical protein